MTKQQIAADKQLIHLLENLDVTPFLNIIKKVNQHA
jgi:hypothetical protein